MARVQLAWWMKVALVLTLFKEAPVARGIVLSPISHVSRLFLIDCVVQAASGCTCGSADTDCCESESVVTMRDLTIAGIALLILAVTFLFPIAPVVWVINIIMAVIGFANTTVPMLNNPENKYFKQCDTVPDLVLFIL